MNGAFLKLLDMSVKGSFLILAVIVLRLALKRAPKWIRCILWAIAALRLICPFSPESTLSLVPSTEPLSGVSVVNHAAAPAAQSAVLPAVSHTEPQYGIVWAVGAAAMLAYSLISCLRLRRRVREAVPMRDNIWLWDGAGSPFILGVIKPRIYLSSGIDPSHIDYVIAHEKAHLSRRDNWWKPLGYVILSIHWFNPLVWAGYTLFCRDIELACDERVICTLGMEEKKEYSHALLACSMQRKTVFVYPLAFGEAGVKERVKSVLTYKKPAFWLVLVSLTVCVIVAVCFLTSPKSEAAFSETALLQELDNNSLAASPKEPDYKDLMAEYEAFGVTEKDGVIYYNGERVRFFLDGYDMFSGVISRFQNYDELGTVDVHTVRQDTVNADGSTTLFGDITDIVPYSQEEFDAREYVPIDSNITVSEALDDRALAERQSQWEDLLTAYKPFGVTYSYDAGSDDFKLYYNGTEVRGIYDEERQLWITEHAGTGSYSDDAVDLYAVYKDGTLAGVREATAEERNSWTEIRAEASYSEGELMEGGRTIAEILGDYEPYGVTYEVISGNRGNIYYNGQLAECFWDEKPDGSVFATESAKTGGTIVIYTVYDKDGNLTGVTAEEVFE